MYADSGHTYRFWSMPQHTSDEPLFVGVILRALKYLSPNHFHFLRVTDGYEVEEFGTHNIFNQYFTITYIPLIAV